MELNTSLGQQKNEVMGELLNALNAKDEEQIRVKRAELDLIIEQEEQVDIEKSAFGLYSGEKFFKLNLPKRAWLVDGLIRERDSVIFVGDEKAGKSLFLSQMICSLTSQHPFIDKHDIPKPCKVTQILLEGDLADIKDRYERMIQTIEFEPKNFQILFSQPLQLHTSEGAQELVGQLTEFNPDILIIDPVYFAFTGSLSDDKLVRQFIGNLRIIQDSLKCALILVHHTHKAIRNAKGDRIQEGDEAIFGSKFFKAWPDHTIMFSYDKRKQIRRLTCDTQRRGDILPVADYILIDKDNNLYFEEVTEVPTQTDVLFNVFKEYKDNEDGLTYAKIKTITNFSKSTFYYSIKPLLRDKIVLKDNKSKPVIYKLNPKKTGLFGDTNPQNQQWEESKTRVF